MYDETRTAYVVISGEHPLAIAERREDAEAFALARVTQYRSPDDLPEYRWEPWGSPGTWRLQSRGKASRRFAWTGYVVHEVPVVGESGVSGV
ncbi:MAG TPA: hypothetical protein VGF17_22130 [Phytomonospora sp.]